MDRVGQSCISVHACGKITLSFHAGAIFVATGKKYVKRIAWSWAKNTPDYGSSIHDWFVKRDRTTPLGGLSANGILPWVHWIGCDVAGDGCSANQFITQCLLSFTCSSNCFFRTSRQEGSII